MLRLIFRFAKRLNEWVVSVQLYVPMEITKFAIIGGVILLIAAGVFASQKVATETEVSHSGIRVRGQPAQKEGHAEVKPTPSENRELIRERRQDSVDSRNGASNPKDRGYYVRRFHVIGDYDDEDGKRGGEGEYFYRNARCPSFSKSAAIERVCSLPQSERHKFPIDAIMNPSKRKRSQI